MPLQHALTAMQNIFFCPWKFKLAHGPQKASTVEIVCLHRGVLQHSFELIFNKSQSRFNFQQIMHYARHLRLISIGAQSDLHGI